jgi:uncharacterized protein YggE
MKVGDLDVVEAIINNEIRLGVLERALDHISQNNFSLNKPSQQDIERFRKQALADLQKKYPALGIEAK